MKKIHILFILTLIFISCSHDENETSGKINLMLSPVEQYINTGMTADFEVGIENAADLYAFSCKLLFNSSHVEIQPNQVIQGEIWNIDTLCETILEPNCLNICIGLTQSDIQVTGSGSLFTFSATGLYPGTTVISLNDIQMINASGEYIYNANDIDITNAVIHVENE